MEGMGELKPRRSFVAYAIMYLPAAWLTAAVQNFAASQAAGWAGEAAAGLSPWAGSLALIVQAGVFTLVTADRSSVLLHPFVIMPLAFLLADLGFAFADGGSAAAWTPGAFAAIAAAFAVWAAIKCRAGVLTHALGAVMAVLATAGLELLARAV